MANTIDRLIAYTEKPDVYDPPSLEQLRGIVRAHKTLKAILDGDETTDAIYVAIEQLEGLQ